MGAVDTTYTFTATDTITSTKMNNIIDQTTMTTDAIIGTTLDVASGKLKVRSQGITSNEMGTSSVVTAAITDSNVTTAKIADANVTTAKIADANVTTAKIADANVTQAKLAPNVAGNGPAFRAYATVTTSVPNAPNPFTIVTLGGETFDTNSNFANNKFTPTVAGYYLFTGTVTFAAQIAGVLAAIYKNGAESAIGAPQASDSLRSNVTDIVYMDGSSDYVELRAYQSSGTTRSTATGRTYLSGCLIRSA